MNVGAAVRGLLAAPVSLLAACSLFMNEVPNGWDHSQGEPDCTASEAAPAADFAVAVPLLLAAATYAGFGLASEDVCEPSTISPRRACALGGATLVLAVAPTWSGLRGAGIARRCRDARRAARAWDEAHPVATASQRLERAAQRAAERREIRRWGSLRCARLVAELRAEQYEPHKDILYFRLPEDCRNRVDNDVE